MKTTRKFEPPVGTQKIAVTTEELQSMLSCGRDTAVQIGESAEARVQIGRRVLWSVDKVKEHIRLIAY